MEHNTDTDVHARLDALESKITEVHRSVESIRKYLLTIVWVTVIALVVPALGLLYIIPMVFRAYTRALGGL